MSKFSETLRRIRFEKKMTQDEFAVLLGTTKQNVSRYESGAVSPKISTAQDIADKLGISLSELNGGKQNENTVFDGAMAKIAHSVVRARMSQRRLTVTEGSRPGVKIVRADAVPVKAGLKTDLTTEERSLLEAFRAADDRAKDDAFKMLLDHPKYN